MRSPLHPRHIHSPAHVQPAFRAPAHKHAHHLHSIPPREKSTRTLIIDHLLWVHARTRFAQARAELGMSDPSGGPSLPAYSHRRRPENYDEDEQALSDGEDILHLKSRRRWDSYDDDDRTLRQDLPLAQSLRLRAEGLESVINSMLDQPPPHHPAEADIDPPRSPKILTGTHPHVLPNGVRLRLALGTVVNDLFARQPPPQPYRHTHPPKEPHSHHASHHPDLPEALIPLIPLSGASAPHPTSSSSHPRPVPSSSTASHYTSGADPSTANSPPSLRCPRHLHTGCPICVETKSVSRPPHNHHRHTPSPNNSPWRQPSLNPNLSGWQDGTGVGSGLLRPGIRGNALRRRVYDDANNNNNNDKRNSPPGGNSKLTRLLPRFLRLSALVAVELGQEARDGLEEEEGEAVADWQKVFNAPSRPRSTRPSAASPSKGKQKDDEENKDALLTNALRPTREWYMLLAGLLTRAVLEGYLSAGWRGTKPVECLLLVGIQGENGRLLGARTRAGDRGRIEGGVGGAGDQGRIDRVNDDDEEGTEAGGDEEEFRELDPDGLPSLGQALRVLFPSLRSDEASLRSFQPPSLQQLPVQMTRRLGQAEAEYELEMYNRLRHFYDIPESTPDLSTHLEDLAWMYPAEPVERAAVRFCEAIARWRGKPELETYKKKPNSTAENVTNASSSASPTFVHQFQQQYSLNSLAEMMRQQQQQQQQQRQPGTGSSPSISASSSSSSSLHPLHPSYHPYPSSYQQQIQQQSQQPSAGGGDTTQQQRRAQVYKRPLIDIYFSAPSVPLGSEGGYVNTSTSASTNSGVGMEMGLGMGMLGMNAMNSVGVRMAGRGVKRGRGDENEEEGDGGGGMVKRFHHM